MRSSALYNYVNLHAQNIAVRCGEGGTRESIIRRRRTATTLAASKGIDGWMNGLWLGRRVGEDGDGRRIERRVEPVFTVFSMG